MIGEIEIVEQPEFSVVGVSIRTTNQNGQSLKDIEELWAHIMDNNLLQKIHGKVSDDIYSIYTDYETDHTGFYTTIIGHKVNSPGSVADGFAGITIPANKYSVYHLSGTFPENIQTAWQEIWNSRIERTYTADFDLYSAGAKSFEATEVKIYVAVK